MGNLCWMLIAGYLIRQLVHENQLVARGYRQDLLLALSVERLIMHF